METSLREVGLSHYASLVELAMADGGGKQKDKEEDGVFESCVMFGGSSGLYGPAYGSPDKVSSFDSFIFVFIFIISTR